jgi:hypothetical protein
MAEDDELERRVRRLTVGHAETRWLARSLQQMVGQVLERLPEEPPG